MVCIGGGGGWWVVGVGALGLGVVGLSLYMKACAELSVGTSELLGSFALLFSVYICGG